MITNGINKENESLEQSDRKKKRRGYLILNMHILKLEGHAGENKTKGLRRQQIILNRRKGKDGRRILSSIKEPIAFSIHL